MSAKCKSPSLTLYKKIHRPFHPIVHRQSVNTQPTHQPFLCLAGWCLHSHLAGQCLARALLQRKSAFLQTKMPVSVTHPTPLGLEVGTPAWCHLGRVVRKPVNANPGLKVNRGNNFSCVKVLSIAYLLCSLRLLVLKTKGKKI